MTNQLKIVKGERLGEVFDLDNSKTLVFGRGSAADVQIFDQGLSRVHFMIERRSDSFWIVDLDSSNGTLLNGSNVREEPLSTGHTILAGETEFCYQSAPPALPADSSDQGPFPSGEEASTVIDVVKMRKTNMDVFQGGDSFEEAQGRAELHRKLVALSTIYNVASLVNTVSSLNDLFQQILEEIFQFIDADRGFFLLRESNTEQLDVAASVDRSKSDGEKRTISHTIVKESLREGLSIISSDAMSDQRFSKEQSVYIQNIRSVICVPIEGPNEIYGAIYLDTLAGSGIFDEDQLELLGAIGRQAGIAVERERLIAKIRRSEERFRSFVEQAPDAIVESTFNGKILSFNRSANNLFGYSADDFASLFIPDLYEKSEDREQLLELYRTQGFVQDHLVTMKNARGEQLVTSISSRMVPGEGQSEGTLESIIRDVTERQRLERELRRSQESLQTLIDRSPILICTIDERGHILKLNEHGNRLLDVSQGEDSKIDENFPGLKQEIHALLSDGNPFERNSVPYPDVSSPRSFFNVKGVPLLDPEGNISGGIVLAEDITRQMELQSQITQQEKMASVGLLAAGIAHEFNNIIASLMGFAQISGSREGLGLDKFRELVLKQMTRAKEITDSLTSFSRGSGTERVEASIEEVLSDVFLLVEKELKTNSIRLELNISPLPLIPINVGQIQQVFLNLIINAVHAMKNGGCLSIDAVASEDLVQISFRDTGSGIKPEHLNKIFEPFFTTKGAIGKSRTPGTGLGLSVSYNVILKHEGRMRVESEPGVGTCFYIDLPRKVFLQPGSSSSAPVEWGDGGPPLHRDLLLVMESSTERDEISTYFGENHLTVASNGREALEICLHKYQDIVFIQESLGGEYSALQTIQRIRVIAPNCPVILLAESPEGEKSFVLPEGVDKVIHPPYSSSLLFQCIS